MVKTNLPAILLRGLVLLPHTEIRLEFFLDNDKRLINASEMFHDNHVLIVSLIDPLEIEPEVYDLPKIGVVAKIKTKIELPDGKIRVVIVGIDRVNIFNYLHFKNKDEIIEGVVGEISIIDIEEKEKEALRRSLFKSLDSFINTIPHLNNSIKEIKDISQLSDIIVSYLPISFEKKQEYLKTIDPSKRIKMLLKHIKNEEEILDLELKIDNEVKKQIDESQREYLLREKIKVIKEELGDLSIKEDEIDNLREKINSLNLSAKIRKRLHLELKKYESSPSTSPEIGVIRNYIDWLISLPWNKYTTDNKDIKKIKISLDDSHYGLEKVKIRIIEYIAVKEMTKSLKSPIICLIGPPGVGKTSLAKSIADSINRKFVKITVGGVNDEAELIGHRRTYIGANPGRIISAMKKAGSSNPVFLIDEIDKMTKDYKGDPASVLLEVLDPEQNKHFSDNYIEEEYDLSKVMFIITANYINEIPEVLKDRLEIIELSGYTEFEKIDIAYKHLLPKILKEHNVKKENIIINKKTISNIIRYYTKEAGVRELERQLATITRKVVLNMIENKQLTKVYEIKNIEDYLGKIKYNIENHKTKTRVGVVNGLAYTKYGGDILPIEVTYFKGKGELFLTGSLGEVMKESAKIALSYIKTHAIEFKINADIFKNNDIHIHVPEGAIPKDGPSAGITLTTALISALTKKSIKYNISMTGEITLRGDILPIGGLKEKSIGAYRNGIKKVIIPELNMKDLDEIPKEIKEKLEFIPVREYKDVINIVYK